MCCILAQPFSMKIINENHRDRQEDISIEELRNISCLKHLNEEGLQEAATVLKKFAQIAYEIFSLNLYEAPVINLTNIKTKAA